MNRHPYLRAYMAGVVLPTWVLLVVLIAFLAGHLTMRVPAGLDRAIVFPMAIVPNVWGLWNVLYHSLRLHRRLSIGAFGAMLPLALVPAGFVFSSMLRLDFYTLRYAAILLPVVMAVYYLAWKYAVAFFNRIVELR